MKSFLSLTTLGAAVLLASALPLPAQDRSPEQQQSDRVRASFEVKDDGEWTVLSELIGKVADARRAVRELSGFGRPGGGFGGPGGDRGPGNFGRQGGDRGPGGGGTAAPGGERSRPPLDGADESAKRPEGNGGGGERPQAGSGEQRRGPSGGADGGGGRREGDRGGRPEGDRRGGPGGGPGGFNRPPNPELEAVVKALEAKASDEEVKGKLTALRESRKQKEGALRQAQDDLRKVLNGRQEAVAVTMGLLE